MASPAPRKEKLPRRVRRFWVEVFATYRRWWRPVLLLAAVIFVPITFLGNLFEHLVETIPPDHEIQLLAAMTGVLTLTFTSMLGEVLLAGAIAMWLAGSRQGRTPSLGQIARHLRYRRLILLDLVYAALVTLGAIALLFPGLIALVLFGLAGPVVELEDRRIRPALARSARLVRTDFWLVFWVLVPFEVIGDLATWGADQAVGLFSGPAWLTTVAAEVAPEVLISPFFSIAAVLLTLQLIDRRADAARGSTPGWTGAGDRPRTIT